MGHKNYEFRKGDSARMKKKYQYTLILSLSMVLFLVCISFAEDIYVTGVTKITMRTGPGVEHKIVQMLKSGTKLEIVEYQTDWSQVRTSAGKTGWVLSRFLTQKVPDALLVEQLKNSNQGLILKLEAVQAKNKDLTVKNAALIQVEEKYKKLKQESAEFLMLDAKYKKMMQQYETQKSRIETLESELNSEPKLWFIIGPSVFIVGLFFGLGTRKKKRSSLL
ncbi:SH3 domain protein [Desulfobacula phenolica]|uniref:SH3 domain protein n=2 Tax=Desulfobacula phenolica TaxID=90732 RepID=A0A1H2DV95_9BACT|nr:SH3 domain protein [Desulfobacula phenolica]